ncbi:MAG: hypothetical protein QOD66_2199, partial [Solirubrobacteraceae bacterium]|nr:hypothetical protein [Solirubrobacteraceae bacterium]
MQIIDSKRALDAGATQSAVGLWQSAVVRRPLTRACWRETGYLILGFVTGTIGFTFLVAAASTAFGLAILIIGLPIAVLLAHIDRWWCGIERWRAALVLGAEIPARYRPPRGEGSISRWLSVLGDRQTWLDALWMLVAFPVGLIGFTVTVSAWSAAFGLLTAPIWFWSIPGWIHHHVIATSILAPFLAVPAAVLAAWLVRGLALAQA